MRIIKENWHLILLFVIFCFGLFLRVYRLDHLSLWLDEGLTYELVQQSIHKTLNLFKLTAQNPLYFFLVHFWVNLFGDSEFSLRFPSVIFGSASIIMIYKVGTLLFDRNIGLISALILGLSTFHIMYSQEARMYTLVSLLTLFSVYFFIKLSTRNEKRIDFFGYIISTVLLLYTHYFGFLLLLAQNIYFGLLYVFHRKSLKSGIKKWMLSQIILVTLFIPRIIVLVNVVTYIEQAGLWIQKPSILSLRETFLTYSGFGKFSETLFVLFTIFVLFSIVSRVREKDHRIWFLLLWLLIPILIPYIKSLISVPVYLTRYVIFSSLAFYILVAKGILSLTSMRIKLVLIYAVVILSLGSIHDYYVSNKKEEWRELATYLSKHSIKGDLILLSSSRLTEHIFNYYFKKTDVTQGLAYSCSSEKGCLNMLKLLLKNHKHVWIVLSHTPHGRLIRDTLRKHKINFKEKGFCGIALLLLEK